MARKKVATRKIGRNAETGRFTSVEVARKHPKTHIVETALLWERPCVAIGVRSAPKFSAPPHKSPGLPCSPLATQGRPHKKRANTT